jgi:hypothetical protein
MSVEGGKVPLAWAQAVEAVIEAKSAPRPAVPRPKSAMSLFGGIVES